jgi:hypothetical protein
MKNLIYLLVFPIALLSFDLNAQGADSDKKSAIVFVENGDNVAQSGRHLPYQLLQVTCVKRR